MSVPFVFLQREWKRMTRRRWIANEWGEGSATLTGTQAAHLARVLRARAGMEFDVATGERAWRAVIETVSPEAVRFRLMEALAETGCTAGLRLHLLIAIFKFDRMEWAIEKAVELGVAVIAPVVAQRTEKHLAQAAERRVERWRRIALEAAQQSRGTMAPEVRDPQTLAAALRGRAVGILLDENEREVSLRAAVERWEVEELEIALGPEGGWTEQERALFALHGWRAVTLGERILRAETAAVAALAVAAAAARET